MNLKKEINEIKKEELVNEEVLLRYEQISDKYKNYKRDAALYGLGTSLLTIPVWGNITQNIVNGAIITLAAGVSAFSLSFIKNNIELKKETKDFKINYVDSEKNTNAMDKRKTKK